MLEFNVRFGDPEAQAILPRLKGRYSPVAPRSRRRAARAASPRMDARARRSASFSRRGGYPGTYETGKAIEGIDPGSVELDEGTYVFHAGTKMDDDKLVTAGGRVLAVTALGQNLQAAIERSYQGVGSHPLRRAPIPEGYR